MWLYQESCAFKAATGVFIGGFVGVMMGVFFGILGADPVVGVAWRSLGDKAIWYCKSFSVITALFSGVDCVVEKARGKHDVLNGGLSGCATGAILAAKQGPQAAGIGETGASVILTTLGCAGFAAFSIAIDAVMHAQE
ncbi:mitochondrial inner membrane translocase subunit Tim17/Tim22/Tim23/peroxisomal protein PMP24 [Pelagophyceae sp. CCMP2097]|nr:mitochondrial inner membrane translocase subunit Tim17/Tim22/Tim23/peroxisomal protein PMP24 [Pelagophyceae sp. CCMP2097]